MADNHFNKQHIRKTFLKFLIPSVGGMLGTSLYVLGDTMIVGRALGSSGLAALNISIPLINVFNGLGLLFGIGGATALSISRGKKEYEDVDDIFSKSMIMALIMGIILTLIRVFFLEQLVYFLGASNDTFEMSKDYLGVLMSFSIMFVLNSALTVFVRNDGSPKLAMWGMLTGSIVNVVLDYVFIFKFKWGMSGGALATGLSPVIGLLILSTHFIKRRNQMKFILPNLNLGILRRIIANGGSSFIVELSAGIVIFSFNQSLAKLTGDIGISAYSIIANLSLIFAAIFAGVGQGIQPIISYNFGANRMKVIYESVKLAIYTSLILGVIFYAIGFFFPEFLVSIFVKADKELLDITVKGIRLYFIGFILMGLNTTLTSFIQSKEYARISLIISLSRGFVLIILVLAVLPKLIGINGIWLSFPIAELLTTVLSIFQFRKYRAALLYTINQ